MGFAPDRRAATLVETLVVLAILALLAGLSLSAMQHLRHTAARATCSSNLRQVGLAMHQCHDSRHAFPSGGWGWGWVGTPDRDSGPSQPGGWIYGALPYLEQAALRHRGSGEHSPQLEQSIAAVLQTPVPVLSCPARRTGGPYPVQPRYSRVKVGAVGSGETVTVVTGSVVRADYAANAGSQGFAQLSAGPATLLDGDRGGYAWPDTALCSGVIYQRSSVSLSDVTRGASNTFLAGERYVNPAHYADGRDVGDNESLYSGFNNDTSRVTVAPPRRDTPGVTGARLFGSAHPAGANMLYCDGAVRLVSYQVDPEVFFETGRRSQ